MKDQAKLTYKNAGVDIERGDDFVARIFPYAVSTRTRFSMDNIGSFAGMIDLKPGAWKDPIMVACTDGVGTKLKFAFETGRHDTIGIDLVAMSVNDLLVTGAEPLAFLDYLASSRIDLGAHPDIIRGIAEGCRQSGCALIGGETAELPGFYAQNEYDLAGFAVGIVERHRILDPATVQEGDVLVGLPSSGIHSNGYSLVRNIFEDRTRFPLDKTIPGFKLPLGDILLTPTRIYRPEFSLLQQLDGLKSAAHITGSGIPGNLPRAVPDHLGISVRKGSWPVPMIFETMQSIGKIDDAEMCNTFNMGLGMILVIAPEKVASIQAALADQGFVSFVVGAVTGRPGFHWARSGTGKSRRTIPAISSPPQIVSTLPRLAILGSGRGSNMDAICSAIDRGDLPAEIACVISNNSRAGILEKARQRGIPAFHVSGKTHPESESMAMLDLFKKTRADTLVLAGYMKKLANPIVKHFSGRSFNIHPALLPAFGGPGMFGQRVHETVLASGVKLTGVTVHRIDPEYDQGEILAQRSVPVMPDDTADTLAARVLREEHDLYWRILRRHLTKPNGSA